MKSRNYETMYIVHPELDSEETHSLMEKYKDLVNDLGGEVTGLDDWGMRRLAYEIDDLREGYYVIMQYMADRSITDELERRIRLDDSIMRMITTREDE